MPLISSEIPERCEGCGACCHLVVEIMEQDNDVPPELLAAHKFEGVDGYEVEYTMRRREDGACIALDPETRLCTIYENRPIVCRDFERGNYQCYQSVRDQGLATEAVLEV